MLPKAIQGDAAFSAFQAKLATVVVSARARGVKISNKFAPGCRCPLGAHVDSTERHPPSLHAHREGWPEVSVPNLSAFIRGYANDEDPPISPYYDLGRAYREQFP
jgi:hypothetical protein